MHFHFVEKCAKTDILNIQRGCCYIGDIGMGPTLNE